MTQKHHWLLFSVLALALAAGSIWAEGKKEQSAQAAKTPKCCQDKPKSSAAKCCAQQGSCQACTKSFAACTNDQNAKEREIERRLNRMVSSLDYKDTPLCKILDDLMGWAGMNIVLDTEALQEAGISVHRPVTMKLEGVALKSVLNLLLKQVHLTYVIKDEVLQVTTESHAGGNLLTRIHPVVDLVCPPRPMVLSDGAQGPCPPGHAIVPAVAARQETGEETLIKLITHIIRPESAIGTP